MWPQIGDCELCLNLSGLLKGMLVLEPTDRVSARDALCNAYIGDGVPMALRKLQADSINLQGSLDTRVVLWLQSSCDLFDVAKHSPRFHVGQSCTGPDAHCRRVVSFLRALQEANVICMTEFWAWVH